MQKKRKKVVLSICMIIAIALVVALIPLLIFLHGMGTPWQGVSQAEADLIKNKELIVAIRDYLISLDYDSISIHQASEPGIMFAGLEHGHIQISNPDVAAAVTLLFNNSYRGITKTSNAVIFQRWAGFDTGRGIIYSIDGTTPYESDFGFTRIEPVSVEGWFYYESDDNELRRRCNHNN
jgi:hypothetical protein